MDAKNLLANLECNDGEPLYKKYRAQLSTNFLNHPSIASPLTPNKIKTNDRLKEKWGFDSSQAFYACVSRIRYDVELECNLLGAIIADKDFANLPDRIRDRVNYYYEDHVQLLLDYAAFANIDNHTLDICELDDLMNYSLERDKYQKILNDRYKNKQCSHAPQTLGSVETPLFDNLVPKASPLNPQDAALVDSDTIVMNPLVEKVDDNSASNEPSIEEKETWFANFVRELKKLASFHSSYIIEWIGYFSMYRLMIVFVRLTWISFWTQASTLGWLDSFGNLFGLHINIELITAPTFVLNLLSVFIFMLRLLFDLSMMLKHCAFPTYAEKGVSAWDRLQMEWNERYKRIGNDFAWVIFNALTNYAIYFNIPIPIANWLLVAFLLYDVWFLAYRLNETEKLHGAKQEQLKRASNFPEDDLYIFNLEIRQLEYLSAETRGAFIFYIVSAMLFVLSFTLFLSISSPVMAPVCFFMCSFVVAMYLSGGDFGAAIRAGKERELNSRYELTMGVENNGMDHLITKIDNNNYKINFHKSGQIEFQYITKQDAIFEALNSYSVNDKLHQTAIKEIADFILSQGGDPVHSHKDGYILRENTSRIKAEKDAWAKFAVGLAENIIMPMLIVGVFTINWPAAIALTVVYIGVKHANLTKLYDDAVSSISDAGLKAG